MLNIKFIRRILIFGIIYSFPLLSIEIYFLAFQRELMNKDEYLYPLFAFMDNMDVPLKYGLQRPNIRKENPHQFLFEYTKETKVRYSKFETDSYGTIKPSDMETGISLGKIDAIFCGGSTTESSLVWQGQRPPDVFSIITGNTSVNASKSGNDIFECVKTIDYLLEQFAENELEKPSNIIIATNINTLSSFGYSKLNNNKVVNQKSLSAKTLLRKTIPGTYYLAYNLKKSFFNNKKDLIDQSLRLRECCFGPANFNKPGSGILFEWKSKVLKGEYAAYVKSAAIKLDQILKKHSFDKDNISIAIEPNSFFLSGVTALNDPRQLLHSIDGQILSLKQSGLITNSFDMIYKKEFEENGYFIITYPSENLKKEFFYDAPHLTPLGSKAIAENYANKLDLKLKSNF